MRGLLAALLLLALPALGEPLEELKLLAEHPVDGIPAGNLSALAWCDDALWALSDRDDDRLYRIAPNAGTWQAEAETFAAPFPPGTALPWGQRMRNWATSLVRGGKLDLEGLSCDAAGNRYLVSEAHAAVLQLPPVGAPNWLLLPDSLIRQARASGMLLHFNALLEGIAVDPAGGRLWLAAERQRRGLLVLQRNNDAWRCAGGCVLLSEGGSEPAPAPLGGQPLARDFSDLAFFAAKLFTLERTAHRICRRQPKTGAVERCWSFAAAALTDTRRYDQRFGVAEALALDAEGAWIGVDNGGHARGDGERRPIVWRFAAPAGGWGAQP